MIDNLTDMINRERNEVNNDTSDYNNHSHRSRLLSRKVSENNNNNNNHSQQHQLTNDYYDTSSLSAIRNGKILPNHVSADASYDTDGALGTQGNRSNQHHHHHHHRHLSSNNYEYLVSPRLPVRHHGEQSSKSNGGTPLQARLSHKINSTPTAFNGINHDHGDRDDDSNYDGDTRRRHIRLSRRVHQPAVSSGNHTTRLPRSPAIMHHGNSLAVTPSAQPLRIIFMRHSERANQALGPDWFNKAFRTNTYKAYDQNLPFILPKRRFDQAYEFDVPLTVRGLKTARQTGRAMASNNLVADICLSSTALRCVQTCERILTGMERRDRIPIRIEPGLFECPHHHHKIIDSFMTKKELMENRYNIKHEYKSIISKVSVPETLEDYFERSAMVMRGIIDRYGHYGGTVLIVTHAPGLLALTDAMKGIKTNTETFYRTVSAYPPLAMFVAEYDGSKWKYSDQPFTLTLPTG